MMISNNVFEMCGPFDFQKSFINEGGLNEKNSL